MIKQVLIEKEQLEKVQDTALFYPCSGSDYLVPIEIFSPYVTDFWFVDRGYFSKGRPADKAPPVLGNDARYELLSKKIAGPSICPSSSHDIHDITPCVLTECYRYFENDKIIRIHRRRGYGFSALRTEAAIGTIGVFFYRGDSQGEGGSGNWWLEQEHLDEVFAKLIDGGLLVLDGSDGKPCIRKYGIYKEICKYAWNTSIALTPKKLVDSMKVVTDHKKREYRCVGHAGMRYGPTMIWQVRQSAAEALGKIGDARAVEALIARLADADSDLRKFAAIDLGKIGDARAVEPLIARLADWKGDVRKHAAEALGNIGDSRAVEPLSARLADRRSYVRRAAAESLAKIKKRY